MLKIGTRASNLAIIQAKEFEDRFLSATNGQIETRICKVKTSGDKIQNISLAEVGGKGLFLKELEEQLLCKEIDVAVHSMKDVSAFFNEQLVIGCVLPREDPREAFVSSKHENMSSLVEGSCIGTSSVRRKYELLELGFETLPIRGNLMTRVEKERLSDEFSAIVLAVAGLKRLKRLDVMRHIIPVDVMLPAVGQGVICVQCRSNDKKILNILNKMSDKDTEICMQAERGFLEEINGDCLAPLAALAELAGNDQLVLKGMFVKDNRVLYGSRTGKIANARAMGVELAKELAG